MTDIEAQRGRHHDPTRLDGFPSLSHFISHDPEAAIFQRFDRLSARNLLYLQSNLNELQSKLDDLDKIDAEAGVRDPGTRLSAKAYSDLKTKALWHAEEIERHDVANRDGWTVVRGVDREDTIGKHALERIEVHKEIKEAMREYREALIQAQAVMSFNTPSNRALSTLRRYFYTEKDKSVLIGCDTNMLSDESDLVTLVQSNDDRLSQLLRHIFGRWFKDRNRNPQPDLDIYYFSEDRIQLTSHTLSIIFSGILLLGAMACLSTLNSKSWRLRLGLLAIFIILFSVVVGLLTNAKRSEIFASTAAYAAVLVVYVSSDLGNSG